MFVKLFVTEQGYIVLSKRSANLISEYLHNLLAVTTFFFCVCGWEGGNMQVSWVVDPNTR